jgi:hypothetical protein
MKMIMLLPAEFGRNNAASSNETLIIISRLPLLKKKFITARRAFPLFFSSRGEI